MTIFQTRTRFVFSTYGVSKKASLIANLLLHSIFVQDSRFGHADAMNVQEVHVVALPNKPVTCSDCPRSVPGWWLDCLPISWEA